MGELGIFKKTGSSLTFESSDSIHLSKSNNTGINYRLFEMMNFLKSHVVKKRHAIKTNPIPPLAHALIIKIYPPT